MMQTAVFAINRIEVRILLRAKPPIIEPTEPTYETEINEETEAQKRNRDIRNQEKKSVGKTT